MLNTEVSITLKLHEITYPVTMSTLTEIHCKPKERLRDGTENKLGWESKQPWPRVFCVEGRISCPRTTCPYVFLRLSVLLRGRMIIQIP